MLPPKLLEAQENRLRASFNLLGMFRLVVLLCIVYGDAYFMGVKRFTFSISPYCQGSLNFGNFVQFGQNYSLIFKSFVLWSYNNRLIAMI